MSAIFRLRLDEARGVLIGGARVTVRRRGGNQVELVVEAPADIAVRAEPRPPSPVLPPPPPQATPHPWDCACRACIFPF